MSVRAAADDAARSIGDAWREAGWTTRVRSLPGTATEALEQLLDRIVKAAIEEPVPVHDAGQVAARLETDGHPPPFGGALFLALGRAVAPDAEGRTTAPCPLALAAKLGADVVGSFRLGAYELELLASQVVNRMRDAKVPVDPRVVQRVTVERVPRATPSPRCRRAPAHRSGAARGDVGRPDHGGGARAGSRPQGRRPDRRARLRLRRATSTAVTGRQLTRGRTWST